MQLVRIALALLFLVVRVYAVTTAGVGVAAGRSDTPADNRQYGIKILSAKFTAPGQGDGIDILHVVQAMCEFPTDPSKSIYTSPVRCNFPLSRALREEDYNKTSFVVEGLYSCGSNVYTYKFGSPQFAIDCFHDKGIELNVPSEYTKQWYSFIRQLGSFIYGEAAALPPHPAKVTAASGELYEGGVDAAAASPDVLLDVDRRRLRRRAKRSTKLSAERGKMSSPIIKPGLVKSAEGDAEVIYSHKY